MGVSAYEVSLFKDKSFSKDTQIGLLLSNGNFPYSEFWQSKLLPLFVLYVQREIIFY